jgi:hypothetical protein
VRLSRSGADRYLHYAFMDGNMHIHTYIYIYTHDIWNFGPFHKFSTSPATRVVCHRHRCRITLGYLIYIMGSTPWRSWWRHCATSRKVAGSIHCNFLLVFIRLPYGPGVDSASNRNEYQGYFLRGGG